MGGSGTNGLDWEHIANYKINDSGVNADLFLRVESRPWNPQEYRVSLVCDTSRGSNPDTSPKATLTRSADKFFELSDKNNLLTTLGDEFKELFNHFAVAVEAGTQIGNPMLEGVSGKDLPLNLRVLDPNYIIYKGSTYTRNESGQIETRHTNILNALNQPKDGIIDTVFDGVSAGVLLSEIQRTHAQKPKAHAPKATQWGARVQEPASAQTQTR